MGGWRNGTRAHQYYKKEKNGLNPFIEDMKIREQIRKKGEKKEKIWQPTNPHLLSFSFSLGVL